MPRSRRPKRPRQPATRGYARLAQNLVLVDWLHQRLGYDDTKQLLADIKQSDEGFDAEGRSHICARLSSRAARMKEVTDSDLKRYDDNIRVHLAEMNVGRAKPIVLRYFQYLAALYTEIYLDRYCNRPGSLLRSLNEFVGQRNSNRRPNDQTPKFAAGDLSKLAFWMATGSGKTLLLHLNYRQFLHYNREPLDNILLITPNEGLSQQHLRELGTSGIPAERFDVHPSDNLLRNQGMVSVIEITKLLLEKGDRGERMPVEAFEGNNLIFVDEGHKGSGGEAWREVRDALGDTGFTFEYSATFGQALAAARNDTLVEEYGKAIAFDYSYRHFYGDGYGKDFAILNLQKETTAELTDVLLLANLLSFYEQKLVFAEQLSALQPYNLAHPLWIFIGGSVNAVYRENKQPRSDILTVVRFLHRVLADSAWATRTIKQLLQGESGLVSPQGIDLFAGKFVYLRRRDAKPGDVYRDVLGATLHAPGNGGLRLYDIRGRGGELGLKASGSDDYFGVIYIGDTVDFKKLVEADDAGIVVEEDVLSGSLFERINEPGSTVEILAGSRKFMEGWNSWRVCNMGLLNIGKSEGSQIIQLFGRGVRLRGRDMTLKRSSALQGQFHPDSIRLLETLNIFAIRANYMAQFRDYLENEGIDTSEPVELPLFIRPNREFLNRGLVVPRLGDGRDFQADEVVMLQYDTGVSHVSVSMSATVQTMASHGSGITDARVSSGSEQRIPVESLDLVDWNEAWLALLEHKEARQLGNLVIRQDALRGILEQENAYQLIAEKSVVRPGSEAERERLQEAVVNILRTYADKLYRHRQTKWESGHLVYKTLDEDDPNLRFNFNVGEEAGKYIVKVPREDAELIGEIERLLSNCDALYRDDQGKLPRIHFDRHLYQPLLVESSDGETEISPAGLPESEQQFVRHLKDYCSKQPNGLPDGAELFLLKNQGRGRGVGFFERAGFYPDFILWIRTNDDQRIVFIEPHGMLRARSYRQDDKATLHERLPEISREIGQRSSMPNVELDCFIISETPFEVLRQHYDDGQWDRAKFASKHILFQDPDAEYDYLAEILQTHRGVASPQACPQVQ